MSKIMVGYMVGLSQVENLPAGSIVRSALGDAWLGIEHTEVVQDIDGEEYSMSTVNWHSATHGLARIQEFDAPFEVLYVGGSET